MRLVFCGTPRFAVPSLKHLLAQPDIEIIAIITQPDRARGRGQEFSFSPVKEVALAARLPVHQPEKIRAPEVQELLEKLSPDAVVIIAYGQIIPARLLPIPKLGWINLHASLLPKYRGAAPIHWAIVNGETRTGVTTMRIDAGMDMGDILLQREIEIGPAETAPELAARMSEAGAPLMTETLRGLASGTITPRPQNHAQATLAPMLKREDGRIDWNRSAQGIYNRMRGFSPWPGAYTTFRGQACHLWGKPTANVAPGLPPQASFSQPPSPPKSASNAALKGGASNSNDAGPGTILAAAGTLLVLCGGGTSLELDHVKREGRKQVSALEFANGARLNPRERFGDA